MAAVPAENGDTRPEQRLAHRLTLQEVDEFLSEFAALIELVELHFRWRPQSPGTNDEMVLEAAVNGHADAIVTYNVGDFAASGKRFGIRVITPLEVLIEVKP